MSRRLILAAVVLTTALLPVAAYATISRDTNYGQGGTAGVAVECAPQSSQGMVSKVVLGGRVYLFQMCAHGFNRLVAVGNDGKVDTSYGTQGHLALQFPSRCFGGQLLLQPGPSGSLFIVSEGVQVGYQEIVDMHVCIARVSAGGKLDPTYGGGSAFRHLDRTGNATNRLTGADVDSLGRLLIFSTRAASTWQHSAEFVNRYTTTGKPDLRFSHDGQRVYVQPYDGGFLWGGVVGTKPVFAVEIVKPGVGQVGTQFIRFNTLGDLDGTFGHYGRRYVSNASLDDARVTYGGTAIDTDGRIVFAAVHDRYLGGNARIDVFRLSRTGTTDSAYDASTTPIVAPTRYEVGVTSLMITPGHYVVDWAAVPPTGAVQSRATGFGDSDGARWTALGLQGSAKEDSPQFAPDASEFYLFSDMSNGSYVTAVFVSRYVVQ